MFEKEVLLRFLSKDGWVIRNIKWLSWDDDLVVIIVFNNEMWKF